MSVEKIVIISTIIIVILFVHNIIGGAVGIKLMSRRCLGIKLQEKTVSKYLPSGDISFRHPTVYLIYQVPESSASAKTIYCLGQDIWFD